MVAGGGGGGAGGGYAGRGGGNAGFPNGLNGQSVGGAPSPGGGGTGTSGGPGGGPVNDPYGTVAGGAGEFGQGGDGGSSPGNGGGGAGGGGYYGGGGGANGGGGGGSSYVAPDATDPVFSVDSTATPSVIFEPLGLTPAAASITFAQTPQQMLSAGQDVTFANDGSVGMRLGAMRLGGANADDFFVAGSNSCEGDLAAGDSCSLRLRCSPSALGARSATLTLHAQALGVGGGNVATTVALSGSGGVLPTGQNGTDGTNGTNGANGKDGAQGPAGKDGTNGAPGTAGKDGAPVPAPPAQTPAPTTPPPTQLLTVSNARSAALAKAKHLWRARTATVISVHRVNASTITCRLVWRTKAGKKRTVSLKVRRTSSGTQALVA